MNSIKTDIINALTQKVRLLSMPQVARTWFADTKHPMRNAARLIKRLEAAGLVCVDTPLTHPEIELTRPLVAWIPGELKPQFGPIAWKLKTRWSNPPVTERVVLPTNKAANIYGGNCWDVRPQEATHELHLSHVYLRMLAERPDIAAAWIPDCSHRSGKRPDVTIPNRGIIEIGGSGYNKTQKLETFHERFKEERYEIW